MGKRGEARKERASFSQAFRYILVSFMLGRYTRLLGFAILSFMTFHPAPDQRPHPHPASPPPFLPSSLNLNKFGHLDAKFALARRFDLGDFQAAFATDGDDIPAF